MRLEMLRFNIHAVWKTWNCRHDRDFDKLQKTYSATIDEEDQDLSEKKT